MRSRRGFTLVEMLVVIGIIGLLVVTLVPLVKGAQVKAKEAAIKAQMSGIETGLANYAQNHNGNYPGVALDAMATYQDHALGDPQFYAGGGAGSLAPQANQMVNGILGGVGHYNGSSTNVFEQIKNVKDTPFSGNEDTARLFDSLILTDSMPEYPANPFVTNVNTAQRDQMRNVFRFNINIGGGFDPADVFEPGNPAPGGYDVSFYCSIKGDGSQPNVSTATDPFDSARTLVSQDPTGLPLASFTPDDYVFGPNDGRYFAPGDFAYVPVLSASANPFGDSAATLENETWKWGTNVSGYLLFAYGDAKHETKEYEDEQREFFDTGLPGYGSPGVDTLYEWYVLQLFEGAIFYSKKV
ncbi:MAG: type II secretion system protein [Planctomycetales bacterium]|nr:type II secretion system protein [bacterium]UNM08925.1 MAG: type II secretion system protein [Planctomycetales bacterium]